MPHRRVSLRKIKEILRVKLECGIELYKSFVKQSNNAGSQECCSLAE